MEAIQTEIISLVIVVIGVFMGIVTQKTASFLNSKGFIVKLENNKELAKIVVNAVQQTYKELNGAEKLNAAKSEFIRLANEKGIKVSENEMNLLIESTVKEMKEAVEKELKK